MATKTSLLGLTKPAYTEAADIAVLNTNFELIDRAVGNGARGANLFVNSNFADPVNWRGQTEYIGNYARTIDGWGTDGANKKIVVANGYVRAETTSGSAYATIAQKVVNNTQYAGKTLTAAAYLRSNVTPRIYAYNGDTGIKAVEGVSGDYQVLVCTFTVPANISDGALIVKLQGKSKGVGDYVDVKWAALYEGTYTVDTLPTYVAPDKRIEMIRCGVPMNPPNLLDNSWFVNPINQRGQTSYTGVGHSIDRWLLWTNGYTMDVVGGGIKKSDIIAQKVSAERIKTGSAYTIALGMADGTVYCYSGTADNTGSTYIGKWESIRFYYTSGMWYFTIYTEITGVIAWAALYEGAYTADTLPAYQYKGYAAELAECMRYYYRIKSYWKWLSAGICTNATTAIIPVHLPVAMRVAPTVNMPNASLIKVRCGATPSQIPTAITWEDASASHDYVQLTATVSGATNGDIAMLYFDNGGVIEFSADL